MIVVLDASAAIETVLQRDFAEEISGHIMEAEWIIAPNIFIAEVTNTFWKYQKITSLPYALCEKYLEYALKLPDDFVNELDLYREAFKTSCTSNHPIYDILYLITARRNNGILLTLDSKLKKLATKYSIEIGP